MFIRVRGSSPGDPLHEFDVPAIWVERHPDRYKVVDKEPVAKARPASHISGVVPEPRMAAEPKARKPRATKTGENDAPSVGPTEEETV